MRVFVSIGALCVALGSAGPNAVRENVLREMAESRTRSSSLRSQQPAASNEVGTTTTTGGGTGVGQSCSSSDGGVGVCQLTSSSCGGIFESGYCPGPSDVECCVTSWGGCTANGESGTCQTTESCSGTAVAGYCPGPSDVQCCISGNPPPPSGSCDSSQPNFCAFATDILNALGAPVSSNNLISLVGWFQAEGNSCEFNPLNTETSWDGSGCCNSVCVSDFNSWNDGVAATVATLQNGYYNNIVSDFANSADPVTTGTDIANSPWGTGQLALECIQDALNDPSTFSDWSSKIVDSSA